MKRGILVLSAIFLSATMCFPQETDETIPNLRLERRTGISFNIGAPAIFGFVLDHFVTPQINTSVTLSPFIGNFGSFIFGGGLNVYPWGGNPKTKNTFYGGIHYSYGEIKDFSEGTIVSHMVYLPVGLSLIDRRGLTASIDGGYLLAYEKVKKAPSYANKSHLFWGMRIGYRLIR